jgi:hypothetical protein
VFAFAVHPAFITLGDAIQVAWGYLAATWRKWLPVVVVVGIVDMVFSAVTSSIIGADASTWFTEDPITGRLVANPEFGQAIGRLVAVSGGELLVTLVAGWAIAGIAIAGLRGRPLDFGWIIGRGVVALLSSILIGLAFVGVFVLWFVAMMISAIIPPVLLVTVPGGIVFFVWVLVRLIFTTLAVFDGHGPVDALSESWALSNRSVGRLLGWGVVAWLLSLAFGILGGIVSSIFSGSGAGPVASGLSSAVAMTGSAFTTFLMAVLYESQRLRRNIMAGTEPMPAAPYGVPGVGPYPGGPGTPGWNSGAAGYPLYGYPTSPQPGWGAPASGGYPGWGNPSAGQPGAYPPNQFDPSGAPLAGSGYPAPQFRYAGQQGSANQPADNTWAGTAWQAQAPGFPTDPPAGDAATDAQAPADDSPGTDTSDTPS